MVCATPGLFDEASAALRPPAGRSGACVWDRSEAGAGVRAGAGDAAGASGKVQDEAEAERDRLDGLWQRQLPGELVGHTRFLDLKHGRLTVQVDHAATADALGRALRSGLQRHFMAASGAHVRRVRLQVQGDVFERAA